MIDDIEPRRLQFAFDHVDIEALSWGDHSRPLALLLHGFPDSAWTWETVGPALADAGWYVVAPFSRGYAPSSLARDDDYSIGSMIADVAGIHRAVGGDCRAIVIGHDWGGVHACAVSASHPELFQQVVSIGVPPLAAVIGLRKRLRTGLPVLARQAPRSWYMPVVSTPVLSDRVGRQLITRLWRLWAPAYDLSRYRDRGLDALSGRARARAAFCYYRAVTNPIFRRNKEHRAAQRFMFAPPRNPTLYLQGADDTCGLVGTGAGALDYLPSGSRRVVVPDAGHFAHLEQPTAITEHILDYLAEARL